MVNIFIANLDWEITSEDLRTTFSAFGPVTYAHVVFDRESKRSKGFGYVEMEETDHAIQAINALHGMDNKELRGPGQQTTRGAVQWRGGHQGGGAFDKPNRDQ